MALVARALTRLAGPVLIQSQRRRRKEPELHAREERETPARALEAAVGARRKLVAGIFI